MLWERDVSATFLADGCNLLSCFKRGMCLIFPGRTALLLDLFASTVKIVMGDKIGKFSADLFL